MKYLHGRDACHAHPWFSLGASRRSPLRRCGRWWQWFFIEGEPPLAPTAMRAVVFVEGEPPLAPTAMWAVVFIEGEPPLAPTRCGSLVAMLFVAGEHKVRPYGDMVGGGGVLV